MAWYLVPLVGAKTSLGDEDNILAGLDKAIFWQTRYNKDTRKLTSRFYLPWIANLYDRTREIEKEVRAVIAQKQACSPENTDEPHWLLDGTIARLRLLVIKQSHQNPKAAAAVMAE